MDVFQWVSDLADQIAEQGNPALASKIYGLSYRMHVGDVEWMESAYPEVMAAAKAMKLPWLEVYARHCYMAVHFWRDEGEKALPEVISLFEFANREETRQCPQSVCTTQDLVRVYGRMDGPGYVPERKQVIDETLARIDPTWHCFNCLNFERYEALLDEGRVDEAIACLQDLREKRERAGEDVIDSWYEYMAMALSLSGQHAEALNTLAQADDVDADDPAGKVERALYKAWILARGGQLEAARDELPNFDDFIRARGTNLRWPQTVQILVEAGLYANDADLGAQFAHMLDRLEQGGCYDDGTSIAAIAFELALQRKALWSAGRILAAYERMRAHLRNPARLADVSARLHAQLAANPTPPAPVAAEALKDHLEALDAEAVNPELFIPWLQAACTERPADVELNRILAHMLYQQDAELEADTVLMACLKLNPADESLLDFLYQIRSRRADAAAVEELLVFAEPHAPEFVLFTRARYAFRNEDYASCIRYCEALIARDDTVVNTRRLLATAAQRLGDHALAAQRLKEILHHDEANDRWDLLISAVVLGDVELAHACCDYLKLPVAPGSMPPTWADGGAGMCVVVYRDSQGRDVPEYAYRIGPVTAEVYEVDHPAAQQRYKDVVVFDASPLVPYPEDEEERKEWVARYRHVHTLKEGGFRSWPMDGVGPSMEEWNAFRTAIQAEGYGVWVASGSDYSVTDTHTNEALQGFYCFVAMPKTEEPAKLCATLERLTRDWAQPISWLVLAQEAQRNVVHHEAIVARFDL